MSGIDHLLDTNVVIGLLKGHDAAVGLAREAGLVLGRAGVSQITRMELLGFPALTPEEDRAARAFHVFRAANKTEHPPSQDCVMLRG